MIDARHPIQENDKKMAEWIEYNKLPCFVIATKVDQISKSKIKPVCSSFERELSLPVFPFCKSNNYYNKDIIAKIEEYIKTYKH